MSSAPPKVPDLATARRRVERTRRFRSDALRIGILSPAWFPVPPTRYGGTEAVVALLADGLVENGHDVTLFASGDSRTRARLVSIHDTAPSDELGTTQAELEHALACAADSDGFDVVSDHTGPLGLLIGALMDTPMVHTVHGTVTGRAGALYAQVVNHVADTRLVSLTLGQRLAHPEFPWIANVPNAINLAEHPCRTRRGGRTLVWIGRMSPDKGPERAIEIAHSARMPLKLAGKMRDRSERRHFATHVEPHLGDGIEYVGEIDGIQRVALLHEASVLLNPIEWAEPFGLVMIEAMACGVPVLATRRGSVPEIVEHGRSGFIVDDFREMVDAIPAAVRLDPVECRRSVEERFAPERMVADYVRTFRRVASSALAPDERAVPDAAGA